MRRTNAVLISGTVLALLAAPALWMFICQQGAPLSPNGGGSTVRDSDCHPAPGHPAPKPGDRDAAGDNETNDSAPGNEHPNPPDPDIAWVIVGTVVVGDSTVANGGKPLVGVQVVATPPGVEPLHATTADDGGFTFRGRSRRGTGSLSVAVTVAVDGWTRAQRGIRLSAPDWQDRAVTIVVWHADTFRVRVVNQQRDPVAGATCVCLPGREQRVTDADGLTTFAQTKIREGTVVRATGPGGQVAMRLVDDDPLLLVLDDAALLDLRITDHSGQPLDDAVSVTGQLSAGEWSCDIAVPRTTLADLPPSISMTLALEAAGHVPNRQKITLTPGPNRIEVRLQAGAAVMLRLLNADGSPVAGATLGFEAHDAFDGLTATESTSDAQGHVTLPGPDQPMYPDGQTVYLWVRIPGSRGTATIAATTGRDRDVVVNAPAGELRVSVRDSDGSAIEAADAEVLVLPVTTSGMVPAAGALWVLAGDAEVLAPGRYHVWCIVEGRAVAGPLAVDVTSGQRSELTVTMDAEGRIRCTHPDADVPVVVWVPDRWAEVLATYSHALRSDLWYQLARATIGYVEPHQDGSVVREIGGLPNGTGTLWVGPPTWNIRNVADPLAALDSADRLPGGVRAHRFRHTVTTGEVTIAGAFDPAHLWPGH